MAKSKAAKPKSTPTKSKPTKSKPTKSTKPKPKTTKTASCGGNNLRKNLLNSNSNNYKIFSSK